MGKDEFLAMEYQKAQDSAEHHDSLLWNVTSIVWAGNLVLFGFISGVKDRNLQIMVCIFGIVLIASAWKFASTFRSIKNQKYARCKEIEKALKVIMQHTNLVCKKGSQDKFFRHLYAIINVCFIIIWIYICIFG